MNRLRLRNAARVKASIEQLGRNWVLHPDHAVTAVAHAEVRAARTETVDTSRLKAAGFQSLKDAFDRTRDALAKSGRCMPMLRISLGGGQ